MKTLAFDTETTNLPNWSEPSDDPKQPYLIQIAAILRDEAGQVLEEMSTLVKPGEGAIMGEEAFKAHGITLEQAREEGADPEETTRKFIAMADQADEIVGHNVSFDIRIMRIAAARWLGDKWKPEAGTFCTMNMSKPIINLPPTEAMVKAGRNWPKPPKLAEAIKHFFNEELEGAHDALVDVRACIRIYDHLKANYSDSVDQQQAAIKKHRAAKANKALPGETLPNDPVAAAMQDPVSLIKSEEAFSKFCDELKKQSEDVELDATTEAGRDKIKSLAYSISRCKSAIDKAGKDLTEKWRRQTNAVNARRKAITQDLDAMRDSIRKPVIDFEEAEASKKAEADAILERLRDAAVISIETSLDDIKQRFEQIRGINLNSDLLGVRTDMATDLRDDAVKAMQSAIDKMEQDSKDAADLQRMREQEEEREAEKLAEIERKKNEETEKQRQADQSRLIEEAKAEAAKEARKEAEAQRQAEIDAANKRAADAEREKQEAIEAAKKEKAEQDAEAKRIADEEAKRKADEQHRADVIQTAQFAFIKETGLEAPAIEAVVSAIVDEKIPATTIQF